MIDSLTKNLITLLYQLYYVGYRIIVDFDLSFSIIHISIFLNIFNLSIRLTRHYIRRIKSGKNFLYDKKIKKFSILTDEEKKIIFYPNLSVLGLKEFLK
jgi:hypothetical protein